MSCMKLFRQGEAQVIAISKVAIRRRKIMRFFYCNVKASESQEGECQK